MPESSADSYINAQPEQAMSFEDYYRQNYTDIDPNNILSKIGNFFVGDVDSARSHYETYLRNLDNRNEFLAAQSARAYDKMMDDTKVQRSMKDYEAAGLNPYLLLNNGSIASGSAPTSTKADYKIGGASKKEKGSTGRDIALLLLGVARLAAALL